jgi:V/A-type H+/Na+-transporting ATPase subunit D
VIGEKVTTRAARQQLVARLDLATRAAELLRSKEEVLERERVRLRGHDARAREEWRRRWQEAVASLLLARGLGAGPELDTLLVARPASPAAIEPDWQTSMGITYPGTVECDPGTAGQVLSTAALVPAAGAYRRALVAAADQAATSSAVRRLEVELASTRRRRRAIEERLQPSLEAARRDLDLRLDELDREEALRVRVAARRQEQEER